MGHQTSGSGFGSGSGSGIELMALALALAVAVALVSTSAILQKAGRKAFSLLGPLSAVALWASSGFLLASSGLLLALSLGSPLFSSAPTHPGLVSSSMHGKKGGGAGGGKETNAPLSLIHLGFF